MALDEINCTFGERIKEERARLGLSQVQLAEVGHITRRTQAGYEMGERSPTGEYLTRITAIGADPQFILTGVRSLNSSEAAKAVAGGAAPAIRPSRSQESKVLDLRLLEEVIESVINITHRHSSVSQATPRDLAKAVSLIYSNQKAKGKKEGATLSTMQAVMGGKK